MHKVPQKQIHFLTWQDYRGDSLVAWRIRKSERASLGASGGAGSQTTRSEAQALKSNCVITDTVTNHSDFIFEKSALYSTTKNREYKSPGVDCAGINVCMLGEMGTEPPSSPSRPISLRKETLSASKGKSSAPA